MLNMAYRNFYEDFIIKLSKPEELPDGVELLYPFEDPDVAEWVKAFYGKYYSDDRPRIIMLGINPGRFGAGKTGIPFTDPIRLQDICGIQNHLEKKPELSSVFIYDLIRAYGGADKFYGDFLFSSVCPFGFVKNGRNINYYDIPVLQEQLESFNIQSIKAQISLGASDRVAVCIGKGKNYKYIQKINHEHRLFDKLEVIPHPRWVMQYRLKKKSQIIDEIIEKLDKVKNQ